VFGYKSHVSIDRRHGIIRRGRTSDAAAHDGARLREGLIDPANTASDVWADTAYRSAANETYLHKAGKVSRIHHKKPRGKPMPHAVSRANAARSKIRARVEHVFAEQKVKSHRVLASGTTSPGPRPQKRIQLSRSRTK
jgi:IS5 family transposase